LRRVVRIAKKDSKVPGLVYERENHHGRRSHAIDQAVAPDRQLANGGIVELTNAPASIRKILERRCRAFCSNCQRSGITRRVPRDVFNRIDQTVDGGLGPPYFVSHFARRCCTSEWLIILPASTSSTPC
jgi:hypothetical protein